MLNGLLFQYNEEEKAVEIIDQEYITDFKGDEGLYQLLDCTMIEYAYIEVNGKQYRLVCDEEGLMRSKDYTMLLADRSTGQVHRGFVGTVLLTGMDAEGEFRSLTGDEVEEISATFRQWPLASQQCHIQLLLT